MNPWDIIGWGLLAIIAVLIIRRSVKGASRKFKEWRLYLRSKNVIPQEGQVWMQEGAALKIGKRWPAGHFTVSIGSASWGETNEQWKERVKNRRCYLISSTEDYL